MGNGECWPELLGVWHLSKLVSDTERERNNLNFSASEAFRSAPISGANCECLIFFVRAELEKT